MSHEMDTASDHRARLVVVERGLDELKATVSELARNISLFIKDQAAAPRPIPFKEIITTAAATLTVFMVVLNFLDTRQEKALEVYKYQIQELRQKVSPAVTFVKPIQ